MKARLEYGENDRPLLGSLRNVLATQTKIFEATRDHIKVLLGSTRNYESGIFREAIIRSFLRQVLPTTMNVDTGFVYGFDQVETSGQIDILVWDARHPPVYRLSEFVIVPPEAVVAAVSVKTNMERADIESGIENLATLIQLDVQFRARASLPPIAKILATFHGPKSPETALETIGRSCQALFAESSLAEAVVPALRDFDPFEPMQEHKWAVTRVLPGLFASLDSDSVSYCQGWGPPRASGYDRHGPVGLRRVPWVYRQGHAITTPIEKVVYRVLEACYLATGLAPGAMLSAWADLNPLAHVRSGDAEEIQEEHGFPMLDAEAIELPAEGSDLT